METVHALPGLRNDPLCDVFYHAADRLQAIHHGNRGVNGDNGTGAYDLSARVGLGHLPM